VRLVTWVRLAKGLTLSRKGPGVTGGVGPVRVSSRGYFRVRLGPGLYFRRRL